MPGDLNLDKLEEVARAATQADWFWAQGRSYDLKQWALCPGLLMADGADGTPGGDMLDRANALHIATFDPPTVLSLLSRIKEAERERDEAIKDRNAALRRAAPVGGTDRGERRAAAKKLLCDICACSAETDPESLDLPHVIADCIEPLETLIAERDACLYLSQEAHKYAGRDGHDILDAVAEKAAADRRAINAESALQAAQARIKVLEGALKPFAAFRLDGFEGEVLEVVPSSPSNPARRIEPIWTSHFRAARSALLQLGGENG